MKKNKKKSNKQTEKRQLATLIKVLHEMKLPKVEKALMKLADIKPADMKAVSNDSVKAVLTALETTDKVQQPSNNSNTIDSGELAPDSNNTQASIKVKEKKPKRIYRNPNPTRPTFERIPPPIPEEKENENKNENVNKNENAEDADLIEIVNDEEDENAIGVDVDANGAENLEEIFYIGDNENASDADEDDGPSCMQLSANDLPYVCIFTLFSEVKDVVACIDISEDGSSMAVGLTTSQIDVYSLNSKKSPKDLEGIDKQDERVFELMIDEHSGELKRTLLGHLGSVTGLSFSPDKRYLVASSTDSKIRLWCLLIWECVKVYEGHLLPVWDVRFSPHGYYFVSAGCDKTARLWTPEDSEAVCLFTGHLTDVKCVQFHPNSNYIATVSSDPAVRLYDIRNGKIVRIMTGHQDTVFVLEFSICGRYLASGSGDGIVKIWDVLTGGMVISLEKHTGIIYSLSFSREGSLLAVGGVDNQLTLWDFNKMREIYNQEGPYAYLFNPDMKNNKMLLAEFFSKKTPILALRFDYHNILLSAGPFNREIEDELST